MRGLKTAAYGLFFIVASCGILYYMFSSEIQFERPTPILHQKDDVRYIDSINYILHIYDLEKQQFDLRHHEKIYEWQHKSTIMIFITTIVVVFTGLFLSFKQFQFTNRLTLLQAKHELLMFNKIGKPDGSAHHPDNDKPEGSTFELSKSGIKITSAVIGLIILAMSIGFVVIYVKYIYPVTTESPNH